MQPPLDKSSFQQRVRAVIQQDSNILFTSRSLRSSHRATTG